MTTPTAGQTYASATDPDYSVHVQSVTADGFIIVTYPDEPTPDPQALDIEQWDFLAAELQLSPQTDLTCG